MKYLNSFSESWKWRLKSSFLTDEVKEDIRDIFLEFDDIKYHYNTVIKYKIIDNIISIYDEKHSPILFSDIKDVIGRIKDYLKINGYFYKTDMLGRSSHYFDGKWNTTVDGIEITVNKPGFKESVSYLKKSKGFKYV
jgi:hypothetical protein